MKSANGKSIMMGAIIGILAVGVSFAAFSSILTINGTATLSGDFNVKFTAASKTDTKATTTVPTIASEGVLSFDVSTDLQEPGSQSIISYTISNLGTIGATLSTPSVTCYSDSGKATVVECSDTDFTINAGPVSPTTLNKTETATGNITVKWNDTNSAPVNKTRYFTVTINANQAQ